MPGTPFNLIHPFDGLLIKNIAANTINRIRWVTYNSTTPKLLGNLGN